MADKKKKSFWEWFIFVVLIGGRVIKEILRILGPEGEGIGTINFWIFLLILYWIFEEFIKN